jgi:retron-type reverse transcriptase
VYPVAAIHGGDEYRIADTGAYRLPAAGKGYKQRGFFIMTDFEKIHSFESLYNAYRKARQGKRWKGAAAKFEVNLLEALNLLSAQIRTKRYTMSPYNTFEVYEPKRRVVMSNSYKDKVVQHSLCDNVLEPILTRSFIRDNYASQVGKGTHYGLDRLQEFMRRFYRKNGIDGWILKGDISKYFYSIRHDVLKTLIRSGRFVACRSYHRQHRRQRRNTDRQSNFTAFRPSLP